MNVPRSPTIVPAIIMAGGQSERMRSTSGAKHKALAEVLGCTLLERNVCKLLGEGFADLTIAIGRHEEELQRYIEREMTPLVTSVGGTIHCLIEEAPLGSIGACGQLTKQGPLLVVFVDNLTAMSYQGLVRSHIETEPDLTIATHLQPFRIPFGEVVAEAGAVTAYYEKPTRDIKVCSGVYVLSERARSLIGGTRRMNAHELVNLLINDKGSIQEFFHDRAWLDVNDAKRLSEAQQLVLDHMEEFECWGQPQSHEVELVVVSNGPHQYVLVHRDARPEDCRQLARFPLRQAGDEAPQQAAKSLLGAAGLMAPDEPSWFASYDRIDGRSGHVVRRHLFAVDVDSDPRSELSSPEYRWTVPAELASCREPLARRTWENFTRRRRTRLSEPTYHPAQSKNE
jgi:NDP-mannose synthase